MTWRLSVKFRQLNINALSYSNLRQRLWATSGWLDMPENVRRNRIINKLDFIRYRLLKAIEVYYHYFKQVKQVKQVSQGDKNDD